MKILSLILISFYLAAVHAGESPNSAPRSIELRDQFDAPRTLTFPSEHLTILAIADRKGSDDVAGWVTPLKQKFGARIDIRGLADVRGVPGPLRGWIRKKFQKIQSYPVMMDWSGEVVHAFGYQPGKVRLLLLDRDGQILQRLEGAATGPVVEQLSELILSQLEPDQSSSRTP